MTLDSEAISELLECPDCLGYGLTGCRTIDPPSNNCMELCSHCEGKGHVEKVLFNQAGMSE
ncbi:hypothetical protein [Pontibacterium sp.]|uniref:hypothetical protein n=1 Tax=Pontibacterium sp. TaxID=2036026 RepID=UPI003569F502